MADELLLSGRGPQGIIMEAEKQRSPRQRKSRQLITQGTETWPPLEGKPLLQVVLALVANIANISPGMSLGFSAVALPQLQNENATLHVNKEEASWIASLGSISMPFGCLLAASMLDRLGRRISLMALSVPCLLGWFLIAFADGDHAVDMIYAGRFFTGLATGMASSPATVYSAEMSAEALRGIFVTWTSIFISLGIFFVYVLGYILKDDWRMVAGLSAVFPICGTILTFFILPETPAWLLSKGRTKEAEINFRKIRGLPAREEMPLALCMEYQKMSEKFCQKSPEEVVSPKEKKSVFFKFLRASTIKPFLIMNFYFFFQQFSGIFVVIFYAVDIVEGANIKWDPYLVAILIGVTRVIVTFVMSYMSNKFGRRPPSIVSGAGMTICMGILATFLYLKDTGRITEETANDLQWVPVGSFLLFILTSTIGFLTLPWAMIGEVFPTEVRGLAAGLTTCIAYIFNFIIVKVYPDMLAEMTEYGVFFFYGAFSLIGTAFVVIFLPETQGKTLLEIEEYFKGKKPKRKTASEQKDDLIQEKDTPLALMNIQEK